LGKWSLGSRGNTYSTLPWIDHTLNQHYRGSKLLGFPTGKEMKIHFMDAYIFPCFSANLDPTAFKSVLVGVDRGVYCGWVSINNGPVYQVPQLFLAACQYLSSDPCFQTVLSLGLNPQFQTKEETVVHKGSIGVGPQCPICTQIHTRTLPRTHTSENKKRWIVCCVHVSAFALVFDTCCRRRTFYIHLTRTFMVSVNNSRSYRIFLGIIPRLSIPVYRTGVA
jgi:hypothetical protein